MDVTVLLRIFHFTFLQAEKESLFIIAAVNDVEWLLFSTVITSTLSTNSSQPKDSSVFHRVVCDVIPVIFEVREWLLLLQWEMLPAGDSYKCTMFQKFQGVVLKNQISMGLFDLLGWESRRQKRRMNHLFEELLLACGPVCGPVILEGRDGLCIARGFPVLWKRMNEKLFIFIPDLLI